jgi:hypothetical protein
MEKLSQEEINRRMIQWRNDRMLEPQRQQRMKELEERCTRLEAENAAKDRMIEKLLLRIEQLEKIIFGSKKGPDGQSGSFKVSAPPKAPKQPRNNASYRRAIPASEEITHHTHHPINDCPDCRTKLRRKQTAIRFVEDIPLPQKMVTKQTIEKGYCPQCRRWKSCTSGVSINSPSPTGNSQPSFTPPIGRFFLRRRGTGRGLMQPPSLISMNPPIPSSTEYRGTMHG